MPTSVGIRELKANLSSYVDQVKAGATVTITEGGKPVGRIVPMKPSLEDKLQQLADSGALAWSGRKLEPRTPSTSRGQAPRKLSGSCPKRMPPVPPGSALPSRCRTAYGTWRYNPRYSGE